MSCCSDLMVFMQFYRQSATWLRRHDALLRGLCSFGPTFSDDSGPPDAPVCIFVVRDGPRTGMVNCFFRLFHGDPGLRGTIKAGVLYIIQ